MAGHFRKAARAPTPPTPRAPESSATGDTYSFGVAGTNAVTDRELGALLTGSLISTIGATFTNNTASTISSLDIAYTGELWRLGATTGRTDEPDFQYSTDATSLSSGTWTSASALELHYAQHHGHRRSQGRKRRRLLHRHLCFHFRLEHLQWRDVLDSLGRFRCLVVRRWINGLAVDDFSLTPQSAAAST